MMSPLYVGVDISKHHLDLHRPDTGCCWRTVNDGADVDDLIAGLPDGSHVVFEATSVCDRVLQRRLEEAGVPFSRVNPRRAREYARAAGYLAKTDKVDARMLATLGEALRPAPSPTEAPERRRLADLVQRRAQLVDMRQAEKVRRQQVDDDDCRRDIDEVIAGLSRRIAAFERKMRDLINETPDLSEIDRTLRGVAGVGDIVAATLIAHLPELGHRPRRAIAALAGLAPLAADSGQYRGKRKIWGGRRQVRRALYIAAVTGRRNNAFGAFYDKLVNAGKPPKVAMVATARKILVTLNAMLRDGTTFHSATT